MNETVAETKNKLVESVAPGQGNILLDILDSCSSDDDNDTTVSPDLKMLTEKYIDSDSLSQMVQQPSILMQYLFITRCVVRVNIIYYLKSTLFNILKALKPSQRKCLSGLDDVQAAAMNGFDYLMKVVKLSDDMKYITMLEQGKCYQKNKILT